MNTGTEAGSQAGENKKGKGRRAPIRCVLTLAFQAFGLCHVIQFLLHPRSVLRSFAALPQHPGPRRSAPPSRRRIAAGLPPNLRRDLPWGKNPARRGARGITGDGENFNRPGGGCKEPRRRGPGLPRAQASADFLRDQRRRSDLFLLISAAVLRLWQRWQRLWRLLASVNTAQSPLWSRMWSTSVALVRMPC